jgi:hypothetical protein
LIDLLLTGNRWQLPEEIQQLADRCYERLRQDSYHPSLHVKKIGRFWSVRVGLHYRALAVEHEADVIWFWIGTHADYDKLIG